VCNCDVSGVEDRTSEIEVHSGRSLRHQVTATVAVQDFYKSDETPQSSFSVRYEVDEQQGIRIAGSRLGLAKGETALLFLTKNTDNTFEFADPFVGAVQFSSLPQMQSGRGLLKLQAALSSLVRREAGDRLAALQVLLGFQHLSEETRAAVQPLSESPDANVALTALGILLRTKSADSVKQLDRYLTTHKLEVEPTALYVIGRSSAR